MYNWLSDALDNAGTVVSANRRLARVLADEFVALQLQAGRKVWRKPVIVSWQDWLLSISNADLAQDKLPTRINAQQSQILWERCLRKEIGDGATGVSRLVKMSRDSWQRLADWQVSITEVARSAQSEDQRAFASVAGRYLGILERENWVDDAGLAALAIGLIENGHVSHLAQHTFVGFERPKPVVSAIQGAITKAGGTIQIAPEPASPEAPALQSFDEQSAELRAAGVWAREQLAEDPGARVAIVATGLEKDGEAIVRRIRDGVVPGWQYGHPSLSAAVNVSYGDSLAAYPAISTALLVTRWLVDDLRSTDVGLLLRSPLLGMSEIAGRTGLELRLRQLPDRRWSPSMVTAEFRGRGGDADVAVDAADWLRALSAFSKRRRELPAQASPVQWVAIIDEVLDGFSWPGQSTLDSAEFQLVNRWRELLNEFARLGLVSARMGPAAAISRLELMANETVFQPESGRAVVQVLGPLEASGARFDRLWVSGVTSSNWPPAGAPSSLISRRLQESHGMPDCTPADTHDYANQVLTGLVRSAESVVCSYASTVDDAEQTASELLRPWQLLESEVSVDPGWHAAALTTRGEVQVADDTVPPVSVTERISGGAATIQRQISEPLGAFVHGRLGARAIYPQAIGIPALIRGNLIHDALYKLYIDLPRSADIRGWHGNDLAERIDVAVEFAFARHERNVDAVLQQLYRLERLRIARLLQDFVLIDGERGEFSVASVEGKFEFVAGNIRLPLRFDRIDSFDDESIAILDYKTGSKKQLLDRAGDARDVQLFVYARATDAPVSALALVNVDSREIGFEGAGRGYSDVDTWPELLDRVSSQIASACDDLAAGDVRINIEQGIQVARPLNLLSRFTELRHDS